MPICHYLRLSICHFVLCYVTSSLCLKGKNKGNNPHHETLTSHLTVSYTATKALPTRCRKGFCSQFKIVIHNQSISFAVRSVCLIQGCDFLSIAFPLSVPIRIPRSSAIAKLGYHIGLRDSAAAKEDRRLITELCKRVEFWHQ